MGLLMRVTGEAIKGFIAWINTKNKAEIIFHALKLPIK